MKYYFQLSNLDLDWDKIKPLVLEFEKRSEAVNIAYNMSKNNGIEIRLTDNEQLLNGSYIKYTI